MTIMNPKQNFLSIQHARSVCRTNMSYFQTAQISQTNHSNLVKCGLICRDITLHLNTGKY